MAKPLVSICLPTYNSSKYLLSAIGSVLEQSFRNWELLIRDNGSTDNTPEVLDSLTDERIKVFRHTHTLPMAQSWNSVLIRAQGDYLKLLCADDMLLPSCLERQVQALQDHPNVVLAAGSRIIVNRQGKRIFIRNGIGASGVYKGADIIRRCIFSGTNIIGDPVAVLWRRSAMDKAGFFDPEILYCTDVEYWLRLLQEGDLFFDRNPVGYYRLHPLSTGRSLVKTTVKDFERTIFKVTQKAQLELTSLQRRGIRFRSWFMNVFRRLIYWLLG